MQKGHSSNRSMYDCLQKNQDLWKGYSFPGKNDREKSHSRAVYSYRNYGFMLEFFLLKSCDCACNSQELVCRSWLSEGPGEDWVDAGQKAPTLEGSGSLVILPESIYITRMPKV